MFEGQVRGTITRATVGDNGFGYDPVFFYGPAGVTFAQLAREEKSLVSHRGRALRSAAEYLLRLKREDILR